jgi:heterodisulfide reductase subunit A
MCEFHATQLVETGPEVWVSSINPSLCKGCGTCASWCPSGAIASKHFTDGQVHAMIDALLTTELAAD